MSEHFKWEWPQNVAFTSTRSSQRLDTGSEKRSPNIPRFSVDQEKHDQIERFP